MTDVDQFVKQSADQGIRRDRWGRYLLPHPDTGKEQAWTRATTLAGTLADRYGLERWTQRNIVLGIGARQDLYAQAAACTLDDKKTLNGIAEAAQQAAASQAGANLGSALHQFTERLDRGEQVTVPEPWRDDVDAYRDAMTQAGISAVPGWVERIVLVPELDVAGTMDRLCATAAWPLPRVADLKTGKDVLRYSMVEIALQLAIYAHATHWWDPATGQLHPVPEIDRQRALVMHLPVGQATCTLLEVDIAAGWDAVQLAVAVRRWRKRNDLANILTSPPSPESARDPLLEERIEWLRGRVKALPAKAKAQAVKAWPDGVPRKADQIVGHPQVDRVAAVLDDIEGVHRVTFHDGDPARKSAPAPSPEPEPQPAPTTDADTSEDWAAKARALLPLLGDEATARACAELAGCADVKMTKPGFERLLALVSQVSDPAGIVQLAWRGPHPTVDLVPEADQALVEIFGSKSAALTVAKALARRHQMPVPRSLTDAASNPVLAALVAVDSQKTTQKEEQ